MHPTFEIYALASRNPHSKAFLLFLHHLPYAFPSLTVGDVDEIDASRQVANVHRDLLALAFDRGHALAEGVDDSGGFQFFASNDDLTRGRVGVDGECQVFLVLHAHIDRTWGVSKCELELVDVSITNQVFIDKINQ